jgi:hypothetical protein
MNRRRGVSDRIHVLRHPATPYAEQILFALLLFAALAFAACGGGGGGGGGKPPETPQTPQSPISYTAPVFVSVSLTSESLPLPRAGEQFSQRLEVLYRDPDIDTNRIAVTYTKPDGSSKFLTSTLSTNTETGAFVQEFLVDSSYALGEYKIDVQLHDAQNLASEIHTTRYSLSAAGTRPITITAVNPRQGAPGDQVTIVGTGFDATLANNLVYFRNAIGSAHIESATDTQLVVIVPERAVTGTLVVQNDRGRTVSPESFSVDPVISLSPNITQVVTGNTAKFSCVASGVSDGHIHWLINGQESPPLSLGTIDAAGTYTAPDTLPAPSTLTITCVSVADSNLRSDAQLHVLAPPLPPGKGVVTAGSSLEIKSENNDVGLTVPADSVAPNTEITVTALDPTSYSPAVPETYNLASARFEPAGLTFSQPVTVTFTLRNWMEPGRELPLYVRDEGSGNLVDTGTVVTVDESGIRATGAITHFSVFVVGVIQRAEEPTLLERAQDFVAEAANFSRYVVTPPRGVALLEGLRQIPVLISRSTGNGTGAGPFANGVRVSAALTDPNLNTSESMKAERWVQASADGWQLATIISIPVINNCGAGQRAAAELIVNHLVDEVMRVPFSVECLDEFHGGVISDRTRVHLFSTVNTVLNPRLHVSNDDASGTEPVRIWAAREIDVGVLDVNGSNGENGASPESFSDEFGGAGGHFGTLFGGNGGRGGPYDRPSQCVVGGVVVCNFIMLGGEPGQNAATGAAGGRGGAFWDKGSVLSAIVDGALALASIVDGDFIGAISSIYDAAEETVKIVNNDENQVKSAGYGGAAPGAILNSRQDLSAFAIPQAGAGGGGGGSMSVELDDDAVGGGAGGGGGAAPSVELITAGDFNVGWIQGQGGNGGNGGSGTRNQTGPGGGGGGGNGAQVVVIAKGLFNSGYIDLKGGVGGISGKIDDGDHKKLALVVTGFGRKGTNGVMRVNGEFFGSAPQNISTFYLGPRLGPPLRLDITSSSRWCVDAELGGHYAMPGSRYFRYVPILNGVEGALQTKYFSDFTTPHVVNLCFDLLPGLNTISLKVASEAYITGEERPFITLHPWENQQVLYFPGLQDTDGDGLVDGLEQTLGTNPLAVDTDGDGYSDRNEVYIQKTNPLVADRYRLSIGAIPSGGGDVQTSSIGPYFAPGSNVTLTATPYLGYAFYQWSGDLTGQTNPTAVTLDRHKTVLAEFLFTNYVNPVGNWLSDKSVSTVANLNLSGPRVDMRDFGNAVFAWRQDDRVLARVYDRPGGWGTNYDLGAAVGGQPQLAGSRNGETVLVWDHWDAANSRWQIFANRHNGEQKWHDPQLITVNAGPDANSPPLPIVATNDNGDAVVMWSAVSNNIPLGGVHTRRFAPATGWQNERVISSPLGTEHQLDLDAQGNAVLIWNVNGIVWSRVLKNTDQMTPPVTLSTVGTTDNRDARVNVDTNGTATVVWAKGTDVVSYRFAYKVDAIDTTGPRVVIDASDAAAQTPHFVVDQRNNVLAVWKQGADIWANQYVDQLGHWLTPKAIDSGSANVGEPRLRRDDYGNGMAAWRQGGEMRAARFLAGQGWQPDVLVAAPAPDTTLDAPRLDLDNLGNAYVVWREWNNVNATGRIVTRYFSTDATDTDGDGLTDAEELSVYETDPAAPDSDNDGLSDGDEVKVYATNPNVADTDGDTFSDGAEITAGTDPLDSASHP